MSPSILRAQQYGSISGKVADAGSGSALTGATIMVSGTTLGAVTDVDGGYLIFEVPPGSYEVICKYLGYEPVLVKGVVV